MKKKYQKPRITKVELVVKEMVLGACWGSTAQAPLVGACQIEGCAAN
jgi:hypothetical protein